jgi:hypothetical protein
MPNEQVAGESAQVLFAALQRMNWKEMPDGMIRGTFRLEARLGQPFQRALMRIEAELLSDDANRIGTAGAEHRTYEQRAADALVALALRVTDALREAG